MILHIVRTYLLLYSGQTCQMSYLKVWEFRAVSPMDSLSPRLRRIREVSGSPLVQKVVNGCKATTREKIPIKFAPQVLFNLSSECLPEGGELVSFDNQTEKKEFVESWSWDFGDAGSGSNNHSNLVDPIHQYQEPGLKSITLRATAIDGCASSFTRQALIDSKPVADFDWISDCFSTGIGCQLCEPGPPLDLPSLIQLYGPSKAVMALFWMK